jgi:cytidylate kinase
MGFIVAVDGTAGSGKGSVTKVVAERLNFVTIDTGAMYRCVTLAMLEQNVGLEEIEKITQILENIKIEFEENPEHESGKKVLLNGKDVTSKIRSKEVNENVSPVSTIKIVREHLAEMQREMAKSIDVIMEGRDIGTNVFPNADVKIYLDASAEERAERRFRQNKQNGIDIPFEEILKNVKERDYIDSHREIAPLTKAPDAVYIDSTGMSIEEEAEAVIKVINEKRK